MINYLASACLSGVLMYSFGFKEATNYHKSQVNKEEHNIINKFLAGDVFQKSTYPQEKNQVQQLKLSTPRQKNVSKSDTFSPNTVQSNIRLIGLNPACYIHYSTLLRAPVAVHQLLTKNMVEGTAQRQPKFFTDPTLSSNQKDKRFAVVDEYYTDTKVFANFNINRGHMAAAGNYNFDQSYKTSTFSLANTIPQDGHNNSGIWNTFERYCRKLLTDDTCDTLQIISGPVYHSNTPHPDGYKDIYQQKLLVMKQNGIMMPPMLYKIIKCNKSSGSYVSGFMFQNKQIKKTSNTKLKDYQTPLQAIQVRTGLNFNFGDDIQSLHEIQDQNLNQTQRYYDQPFYRYLIQNGPTIQKMSFDFSRAYKQGIYINPEDFHDKILKKGSEQFQDINSSEKKTVCHKLYNQLSLHKRLFYMKLKGQLMQNIDQSIYNKIIPCKEQNGSKIKKIVQKLQKQNKRYSYPHKIFMNKVFSTYRQQNQQLK